MPDRLWGKNPRNKRYRSRRRPEAYPWASRVLTRVVTSFLLVALVWLFAMLPAAKGYLRLCLVPGAAAQSPWGEWLDWQPESDSAQSVWVALTGRQDRLGFDFPIEGEIVAPFGWTQDKETGAPMFQDHLIIRSEPGAMVKAVLSGRVVQVDVGANGYSLILDHGAEMKTVYLGCEAVFVKIGDKVKARESIARAGISGEMGFKVLAGDVPTDPLLRARPGVR